MKQKNLLTEREQRRFYLLHHMHHFEEKKQVIHDLHHCFLFAKRGMKGEKFKIKHLLTKGKLFHVLDKNYNGYLYDHTNNKFKITEKKIKNKKYSIIG